MCSDALTAQLDCSKGGTEGQMLLSASSQNYNGGGGGLTNVAGCSKEITGRVLLKALLYAFLNIWKALK